MGQCIAIDETGVVTVLANPSSECPGYVLLSGSEYVAVSISQGIFALPTPEETASWFFGPMFTVVFFYVAGRAIGAVANMFR